MKLSVCDLVILEREVEVPDECQGCKVSLKEGGLKHWEYQDQSRYAVTVKYEDGDEGIDWMGDLPKGGEAFIPLEWQCASCGFELVMNNAVEPTGEVAEQIQKALGWPLVPPPEKQEDADK